MKRFSIIAAAIISVFLLTVPNFAQSAFWDLLTGSGGQSILQMFNLGQDKPVTNENLALFKKNTLAPQVALFSQDFSSSNTVTNYVNAVTPTNAQFNTISSSGASTVVSINNGSLQYARGGANTGNFTRSSDFSPTPTTLLYKFDITISGNTAASTTAVELDAGSGFTGNNSNEANANIYSKIGFNLTATNGTFSVRDISNSASSTNFSGTQTITWAMNNSGNSITYVAPDGNVETLANDKFDVFVGTTRVFNDASVTTATQTITDIKGLVAGGSVSTSNYTVQFDNFLIDPITTITPVAPTITSANSTTFTQGSAGTFTVTTSGTPAITTITEMGTLPNGITFTDNGNGTATISGTPTQSGSFPITITASNGVAPNATQSFTLTVNAPVNNPPTITPQSVSVERGATVNNVTIATVTDDGGNGNVNVSVTSANPSAGITLSNITNTNGTITATVSAACGSNDTSFTLSVSDGVNTPVTANLSATVTDSSVATQVFFFNQPTNINSGATFSPVVSVSVANACGGVISSSTAPVTLTLNGANGTLGGTTTVNAVNGTAQFSDLTVNATATGSFTLTASSAGLTSSNSASFTVTAAATPGVTISPMTVDVTEGGATAVYSVVLNSQPTADVTVSAVPFNGQATVTTTNCIINRAQKTQRNAGSGAFLVFTPQNYASPQCILVTAVDDTAVEGPHFDFIDHSVTSTDTNYNGIQVSSVDVNITDDEMDNEAPVIIYTPLNATNTTSSADRRVLASVFDSGFGVVFAGNDRPRIYFNKNGGVFVSQPCNPDGVFYCDIDYSLFLGGVQSGDIISYFVVAQDLAGNVGSNPGGITGTSVNSINIPPGYAPNAYAIDDTTVSAGNYSTLNVNGGSLGGNVTVLGSMSFNGIINVPSPSVLTIDCNATLTGGTETAFIVGSLSKKFCDLGTENQFTYPIGTALLQTAQVSPTIGYVPFSVNVTSLPVPGSALTVSAVDNFLPGSDPSQSVSLYYDVTETGDLTADMTYRYLDSDIPAGADETAFKVLRRESATTVYADETAVDETTNTATVLNVSQFSQWGVGNLAPTAANVSVKGQVRAGKAGISGAVVMITGGNLTQPVYARTNNFGNYRFEGLAAGETYIVSVSAKRYNFPQSSIVLNVSDSLGSIDFEAEER